METNIVHSAVRCGGCRCVLFNTESHGLLDSHSQPLHTQPLNADSCSSLHERSNLYLDDENLPPFAHDAVVLGSFTSGRLKCSKCGTRLGAFNYVKGSLCSCSEHTLPPVHLSFSKVDYLGYVQNKSVESNSQTVSTNEQEETHPQVMFEDDTKEPLLMANQLSNQLPSGNTEPAPDIPPVAFIDKTGDCSNNTERIDEETDRNSVSGESTSVTSNTNPITTGSEGPSTSSMNTSPVDAIVSNESYSNPVSNTTNSNESQNKLDTGNSSSHNDALFADLLDRTEFPDHLVCAICLELLFCPFSVKPCGHVYCEPCLRRLARPSPTNTACPLCREIIGACQPAAEYCREIRQNFPKQCAERHKFEQSNSAQHLPLPWLQGYRFLNFDIGPRRYRSGSYTRSSTWFYTAFWIFLVDIVAFLFILSLNWIMTQTINNSVDNLPSPPHLPDSKKIPVLHSSIEDTKGDNIRDPIVNFDLPWEEGDSSTDYSKERKLHHPLTVSPIESTTYQPPNIDDSNKWITDLNNFGDSLSAEESGIMNANEGTEDDINLYLENVYDNYKEIFKNDLDDDQILYYPTVKDNINAKRIRRRIKLSESVHSRKDKTGKSLFQNEPLYSKDRIRWWAD